MLFAHYQMGQIQPIYMHIGKISQFFKIRGFPATQAGLCIDNPHNTARDLQNTPGTPAMHFPLVASGSQSALYGHNYIGHNYIGP